MLHTPDHTPGSVSLRVDDVLLSGDTLSVAGVGRPDLEGDDEDAVLDAASDRYASVRRLRDLTTTPSSSRVTRATRRSGRSRPRCTG